MYDTIINVALSWRETYLSLTPLIRLDCVKQICQRYKSCALIKIIAQHWFRSYLHHQHSGFTYRSMIICARTIIIWTLTNEIPPPAIIKLHVKTGKSHSQYWPQPRLKLSFYGGECCKTILVKKIQPESTRVRGDRLLPLAPVDLTSVRHQLQRIQSKKMSNSSFGEIRVFFFLVVVFDARLDGVQVGSM